MRTSLAASTLLAAVLWSQAVQASLEGEWVPANGSDYRLTLRQDESFELTFNGAPARQMYLSWVLEIAPSGVTFGYGITARPDPEYVPSDPASHVHQLSTPVASYLRRERGTWTATGDSLRLMVTAFELPEVDGVAATAFVSDLIREEFQDPSLDEETRAGLVSALENIGPVSISADSVLIELSWKVSEADGILLVTDMVAEHSGEWVRDESRTATLRWSLGELKLAMPSR